MQLSIIRKDTTPSGQEELHTESVAVTVKEGAEKPVATKPGMDTRDGHAVERVSGNVENVVLRLTPVSFHRREATDFEAAPTARHGPTEAGGEGAQGRAESPRQ